MVQSHNSSSSRKLFECPQCPFRSRHQNEVLSHLSHAHSSTEEKPFVCSMCPFTTKVKTCLEQHTKTHGQEKPFKCLFSNCDYASDQQDQLILHVRTHEGENPYKCRLCSNTYSSKFSLDRHIQNVHCVDTLEVSYDCTLCPYTCKSSDHLSLHMKTHLRPLPCNFCPKLFSCNSLYNSLYPWRRKLDTNFGTRSQKKRYKCPEDGCPYSSASFYKLNHHRVVHTKERPFECSICHKKFAWKSSMTKHMRVHYSSEDERPFACTKCPRRFQRQETLQRHAKIHEKEKVRCGVKGCQFWTFGQKTMALHWTQHNLPIVKVHRSKPQAIAYGHAL